jgi:hypothetical protein
VAYVLLDHCVSRKFARLLPGHEVVTCREVGFESLANGKLLEAAMKAGFGALLTVDKNIPFQHSASLPLPVIVVDSIGNSVQALAPYAPSVLNLLTLPLERRAHLISRRL